MTTEQCSVSPQYVGTPHGGDVHLYRSTQSNGEWWICDAHAEGAPARGIDWLVPAEEARNA